MIPVLRNEDINTTVNNNDISKIKREREIVIIQSIISIHVPVFKFHMAPPRPRKQCTRATIRTTCCSSSSMKRDEE